MDELISSLRSAGLIDGDSIVLEAVGSGESRCALLSVSIEDFANMFGEAAANGYEALIAADENADGTAKGYKRFFDTWRAAGIL